MGLSTINVKTNVSIKFIIIKGIKQRTKTNDEFKTIFLESRKKKTQVIVTDNN